MQTTDRERDLERLLELLLLRLPRLLLRERRRLRDLWMCSPSEIYGSFFFFFNRLLIEVEKLIPGAAARVGPSLAGSVFHQANLSSIDVRAIQLVQGPLHVGVRPKLDNALIRAFLMGIGISKFSCLTREVLELKKIKSRIVDPF